MIKKKGNFFLTSESRQKQRKNEEKMNQQLVPPDILKLSSNK